MEGMTNTLLPAKYAILFRLILWKRNSKSTKAKSKCLLFLASFYCVELEAVSNRVLTERNTAVDVGFSIKLKMYIYELV